MSNVRDNSSCYSHLITKNSDKTISNRVLGGSTFGLWFEVFSQLSPIYITQVHATY
jgi:hypothetical protein